MAHVPAALDRSEAQERANSLTLPAISWSCAVQDVEGMSTVPSRRRLGRQWFVDPSSDSSEIFGESLKRERTGFKHLTNFPHGGKRTPPVQTKPFCIKEIAVVMTSDSPHPGTGGRGRIRASKGGALQGRSRSGLAGFVSRDDVH